MTTFAAIDIGSNSCRLKIARVQAHQLKTLAEDREVTRLGGSVFDTGLISPEAMAATLRALKRFQRAVQSHGVDRIRVVATSAMRDARNSAAFQAWVKAETGWNMEIISGLEEGRLIHLGVTGAEPGAGGRVLLVDLGGGSCELTLSEHKHIKETVSLPLGAVRLTEQFLPTDPAPADGLARMQQLIARELRRAHRRIQPGRRAAGDRYLRHRRGAIRCLRVERQKRQRNPVKPPPDPSPRAPMPKIAPPFLPAWCRRGRCASWPQNLPGCRSLSAKLCPASARGALRSSSPARRSMPKFSKPSALPGFRYSPLGLRDGILAQMLAEQDARAKVHREFEHERWESVLATARRYGVDPRHAEPVRVHALQLFRELKSLHLLPPEYESWLAAAALLRDTGKFINHQGHHRHTQYIVSSSEIYGYTQLQRTLVSAIARYMGKSRPQPGDRALRNIPAEEHKNVHRAVVLLRLAVALNQDRASDVLHVAVRLYPKAVHLELRAGRTGAELELWSLRKEAGYFREVFGRELFVALA